MHLLSSVKMSWICAFALIASVGLGSPSYAGRGYHSHSEVRSSFMRNDIVPSAFPCSPERYLYVDYDTSSCAKLGNELTPTQALDTPTLSYLAYSPRCDRNELYTLFMIDLDAPDNATFLHWFVVNIPGEEVEKGDVVTGYYPPEPPSGSGLHRYVFLVYKQPCRLTPPPPFTDFDQNFNYSISKYVNKNKLGVPYAGNFFKAQSEPTTN